MLTSRTTLTNLILLAVLFAVGICIYANTLNSPFHFDDLQFAMNNYTIRDIQKAGVIWNEPNLRKRLLPFLSFAANYHFHQYNVFGYHLINIVIHILNSMLVWWFASLIFSVPGIEKYSQGSWLKHKRPVAFLSALFFLAHPIQTESVTYISQRFTSMAALFYLFSLCVYLRGRLDFIKGKKLKAVMLFLCAAISGIMGMFSKEIVFTLPFCILLSELFFFKGKKGWVFWTCIVAVLMSALIIPSFFSFNISSILSRHSDIGITSRKYFLTQFRVILTYIRLLFFPVGQNVDYEFSLSRSLFSPPSTFFSLIALIAVLISGIKCFPRKRLISYGIFWFFLTLSVESSIVPIKDVIFEHRLYLPSVGFFIALCVWLFNTVKNGKLIFSLVAVILLMFCVLTFARNQVWGTDISLWEDTVRKSPGKSRVYLNLGRAYYMNGSYDDALEMFNKALSIKPGYTKVYNNRALVYQTKKMYKEALADFDMVLSKAPMAVTYYNKGRLYIETKQYAEALEAFNKAVKKDPNYDNAYSGRGVAHEYLGDDDLALADLNKALKLNPSLEIAYSHRAIIYIRKKKYDLALDDLNKILKYDPESPFAYYYRSQIFFRAKGQPKEALKDALKAQSLGQDVEKGYLDMLKSLTAGK